MLYIADFLADRPAPISSFRLILRLIASCFLGETIFVLVSYLPSMFFAGMMNNNVTTFLCASIGCLKIDANH